MCIERLESPFADSQKLDIVPTMFIQFYLRIIIQYQDMYKL